MGEAEPIDPEVFSSGNRRNGICKPGVVGVSHDKKKFEPPKTEVSLDLRGASEFNPVATERPLEAGERPSCGRVGREDGALLPDFGLCKEIHYGIGGQIQRNDRGASNPRNLQNPIAHQGVDRMVGVRVIGALVEATDFVDEAGDRERSADVSRKGGQRPIGRLIHASHL